MKKAILLTLLCCISLFELYSQNDDEPIQEPVSYILVSVGEHVPKRLAENRECVHEIIAKLPGSTAPYDKIIYGFSKYAYYIVVGDSAQTEYFAYPDSTFTYFNVERWESDLDDEIIDASPFFEAKNCFLDPLPDNIGSKASMGRQAYMGYIDTTAIKSDMIFQVLPNPAPVEIEVLVFFAKKIVDILIQYRKEYPYLRNNREVRDSCMEAQRPCEAPA